MMLTSGKSNGRVMARSLTELEIFSRNELEINLADGHMAWYDAEWMHGFDELLAEVEAESRVLTDREAEAKYINRFMRLFGQLGGIAGHYKVLPNASLSIDVLMGLAKRRDWRVQLIDPCFDNLYLYAHEKGIELTPLHEADLRSGGADAVDTGHDLVVLISPNNPTGWTLPEAEFRAIAKKCARSRTTLAIDASFRAYCEAPYDQYAIAKDEGVSFVIIEDTGKTLPTLERKVSLIVCSNDLKDDVNQLAEIHVLGWCKPVLLLCERLFGRIEELGLETALHATVRERRERIRRALRGTFLRPAPTAKESLLPVEWLEVTDDRYRDDELTDYLRREHGLGLLSGRQFFWSSPEPVNRFVRLTLMKETDVFKRGADLLRSSILDIKDWQVTVSHLTKTTGNRREK